MKIPFYKYHGTGNDFILVNGLKHPAIADISNQQVASICERHFGIGADGFIILAKDANDGYQMIYYNSDGNKSTMCGNGGRCLAKFAFDLGLFEHDFLFQAIDGIHRARIYEDGQVELHMIDVDGFKKLNDNSYEIQTGSPHFVQFLDELDTKDIIPFGREVRYSEQYKTNGINVNLACLLGDVLHVRTYERGVEDETLSCGTGVTAAAICATDFYKLAVDKINISSKGGDLSISFKKRDSLFTNVLLTGPATFVYTGEIII